MIFEILKSLLSNKDNNLDFFNFNKTFTLCFKYFLGNLLFDLEKLTCLFFYLPVIVNSFKFFKLMITVPRGKGARGSPLYLFEGVYLCLEQF